MGGRRGRLISAPNRKMAIELIEEATAAGAREKVACEELGITQRTLQRWRSADNPLEDGRPNAKRPVPSNKLSEEEVTEILKVVNLPEFQSKPPTQIVPYLADRGVYLASESTIYRILREHKMQHHRGRSNIPWDRYRRFVEKLTRQLSGNYNIYAVDMIESLNQQIAGWANFYQYADYTATIYRKVDHLCFGNSGTG